MERRRQKDKPIAVESASRTVRRIFISRSAAGADRKNAATQPAAIIPAWSAIGTRWPRRNDFDRRRREYVYPTRHSKWPRGNLRRLQAAARTKPHPHRADGCRASVAAAGQRHRLATAFKSFPTSGHPRSVVAAGHRRPPARIPQILSTRTSAPIPLTGHCSRSPASRRSSRTSSSIPEHRSSAYSSPIENRPRPCPNCTNNSARTGRASRQRNRKTSRSASRGKRREVDRWPAAFEFVLTEAAGQDPASLAIRVTRSK